MHIKNYLTYKKQSITTAFALLLILLLTVPSLAQDNGLIELNYEKPQSYNIESIEISGIEFLDENALIIISGLSIGKKINIPGDDIALAIRKLWKQGLFEDISISVIDIRDDNVSLNISLKERPRLSGFNIQGTRKSSKESLRDKSKLVVGDVVTENLMIRTKEIIEEHFVEKGFFNANVEVEKKTDPKRPNSVELEIKVKKNNRIRIDEINIIGNKEVKSERLKSSLKETKEKAFIKPLKHADELFINLAKDALSLKWPKMRSDFTDYLNKSFRLTILKSSKFIPDVFEDDKALMIDKYNKLGYRDAKIINDSVYRKKDNTMAIDIRVDEGNKYYFRNINWVGNTVYSDFDLDNVLQLRKGDPYNKELLETNLSFNQNGPDVSSMYLDNGYLFFNVDPIEVQVENDSIDLEIRIREGEQAYLKNIIIKGNTRTNDHVIVRELRTRPGQLFSRDAIIRTQRELAQLKYFNPETLDVQVLPDPLDGTVDIVYTVEETSSDQIELSGGWGYGRIIGTVGLSFNNFSIRNIFNKKSYQPIPSGDGQKLSLRFQTYGAGYMSYSASFTEPWLGGKRPNALSVSLYHSKYSLATYDANVAPTNTFAINGLTVGIGRRLTWPDDFFQMYMGINLQQYDLNNYSIFSFGDGTGQFNNFNYTLTINRNSTDQPIYPRGGSDVGLTLELTPPYSSFGNLDYSAMDDEEKYKWVEYHKWKVKANFFSSIVGDLVLSTRTQFGFLGYYNKDIGVTPFDRFFLGGDGLSGYNNMDGRELIALRGYSNEALTPNYATNTNLGGVIYNKFTLEMRYPLSLNPSATIYVMGYLEGGNSWDSFSNFRPFEIYKTAGIGVRVFLPMFGLLGLDWGYGFDDVPGLPDAGGSQFHFSINQSLD
ncbi:MAG: BamA/TamA family outer membrane protein [Bacteroidales bacterium]|jgi:outer membrane protein insertion porin family|nr:BamA/TamA family outer membrane protein [Bacteroidales bacterium]